MDSSDFNNNETPSSPSPENGGGDEASRSSYRPTLDEARMTYIQKNAEIYAHIFARFDQGGRGLQPSFCVPAFIFSSIWFIYRKMYVEAAALFLISFAFEYILAKFISDGSLAMILMFALWAAIGLYARWFFWKAVDRKLEEAGRRFGEDPRRAMEWLKMKGGVNFPAALGVAVILLVLAFRQMAAMAPM